MFKQIYDSAFRNRLERCEFFHCFAHKTLRHFTTSEDILKIDLKNWKKNDRNSTKNLSYQECDKCAYRHDARLWKWHAFTHTSWILTDEILTWPKCILWHGWCTFHLTADKAESLAQVSVNESINACVYKNGRNGEKVHIFSHTLNAVCACELKKMFVMYSNRLLIIQMVLNPINRPNTENSQSCCLQSHANRDYGCNVKMCMNVLTEDGWITHALCKQPITQQMFMLY